MDARALERVPRTEPSPAATLRKLLETGYFNRNVSLARVGGNYFWFTQPRACCVGLGCRHQRGVSAGAPVETLGLLLRGILACRELGIPKLYCVIGQRLAAESLAGELRQDAMRAGDEHRHIVLKVARKVAGKVEVQLLMDREIQAQSQYAAGLARVSQDLGTAFDYLAKAAVLFEVVRRSFGACLKVGWTRLGERQYAAVYELLEQLTSGRLPKSSCEVVFDTFRDLRFPESDDEDSFLDIYGPPAVPFDLLVSQACPYVSSGDTQATRLLLRRQERSALQWKIPEVKTLQQPLQLRMARATLSHAQLCMLAEEIMPGLLPASDLRTLWHEHQQARRRVQRAEATHGPAGREFTEASTALNRLTVERATQMRRAVIPALSMLIGEFAADS